MSSLREQKLFPGVGKKFEPTEEPLPQQASEKRPLWCSALRSCQIWKQHDRTGERLAPEEQQTASLCLYRTLQAKHPVQRTITPCGSSHGDSPLPSAPVTASTCRSYDKVGVAASPPIPPLSSKHPFDSVCVLHARTRR